MKKTYTRLLCLFLLTTIWQNSSDAQAVNNATAWPDANWVVSGSYNGGVATTPDVDATFSYDDDADGSSGAAVNFVATSPVIDLTPAQTAGENSLELTTTYSYNTLSDFLTVEYFDADAAAWVSWGGNLPDNAGSGDYLNCTNGMDSRPTLDISAFTTTQLSGFQYRFIYDDAGGWKWGYCVNGATLASSGCVAPTASGSIVDNCPSTMYDILVDVTNLGSAGTVNITENTGTDSEMGVGIGMYTLNGYPGGSGDVTVTVADGADATCLTTFVVSIPAGCPPPEDNCMGAINIPVTTNSCTGGVTTGNNTGATDSDNDVPAPPAATCSSYGGGDIWFSLTVPASGNVTISGDASPGCCSFLWYEVYSGADCMSLTSIMCSSTSGNDPSQFEMELTGQTGGSTLWIRAWDSSNDNGPGDFNFCAYEPLCVPATIANDAADFAGCPASTAVNFDVTAMGSATSWVVTNDAGGVNPADITAPATGISITGLPATGTVTITLTDSGDPTCTTTIGPISLMCPPSNDACGGAIPVTSGSTIAVDITAATDVEAMTPCQGSGTDGVQCPSGTNTGGIDWSPGVWYVFNSTSAENITISLDNSFDSEIQVFEGPCGSLTCVTADDDGAAGGCCGASVCFTSTANFAPVDYYIYVDGHNGATGTSVLTVNAAPLPIELISFNGKTMEEGNKLTWSTAIELNTDYHVVERSVDGQNGWDEIGRVAAAGSSFETLEYSFMDDKPLAKSYYRLVTIDLDKSEQRSEVVSLERENAGFTIATTFPNPTSNNVTVQYHSPKNVLVEVHLTDISGRIIHRYEVNANNGINNLEIKMADLTSGTYFLSLSNSVDKVVERLIKQ